MHAPVGVEVVAGHADFAELVIAFSENHVVRLGERDELAAVWR
jgi:hypothetical protein